MMQILNHKFDDRMENIEYLLYMSFVISLIQEKELHLYDKPLHTDLEKKIINKKRFESIRCDIYHELQLALVHEWKDRMRHYKYNYPVTIFDVMVNECHGYLRVPIDSRRDFHQSIFVQYVHWLLIFVFFLPKIKR
jgi:hypothetical protein